MIETEELILRIFIAGLLGGAIGFEREYRAKEAGIRTHFLVALGSGLFMVLSQFAFGELNFDASRVAAQVVSGIGFIGAGIIIFQKNEVRGLTTAAGLWVASAIGMTCGAGMYGLALAATGMVIVCLETMNFVLLKFGHRTISITFVSDSEDSIMQVLERHKFELISSTVTKKDDGYHVSLAMRVRRKDYIQHIYSAFGNIPGVTIESIE